MAKLDHPVRLAPKPAMTGSSLIVPPADVQRYAPTVFELASVIEPRTMPASVIALPYIDVPAPNGLGSTCTVAGPSSDQRNEEYTEVPNPPVPTSLVPALFIADT